LNDRRLREAEYDGATILPDEPDRGGVRHRVGNREEEPVEMSRNWSCGRPEPALARH
jgi:hypothetical protein